MGDPLGFDSPPATPGAPHAGVRALVTLGTPQRPPPAALARDMTGGVARAFLLPPLGGAHQVLVAPRFRSQSNLPCTKKVRAVRVCCVWI